MPEFLKSLITLVVIVTFLMGAFIAGCLATNYMNAKEACGTDPNCVITVNFDK